METGKSLKRETERKASVASVDLRRSCRRFPVQQIRDDMRAAQTVEVKGKEGDRENRTTKHEKAETSDKSGSAVPRDVKLETVIETRVNVHTSPPRHALKSSSRPIRINQRPSH
jgi:hypothetical protein